MSQRKIDPATYVALKAEGLNNMQIADRLGVSETSVRRGLKAARYNPNALPVGLLEDRFVLDTPLVHTVDKGGIVVTADWHLPVTDFALVNQVIDHAREVKARSLAVAGDWFNLDALSRFDFKQPDADLMTEIRYSGAAMEAVLETFESIYFTWGNHDNRLLKLLGYTLQFKEGMKLLFPDLPREALERIRFSNLDHMIIDTPRGPYRVSHPASYSATPLANPRKQASKYLMHALSGHTHHFAFGYDMSGQYSTAELGGLHRKDATGYLQRTTNYPNWSQGYAIVDSQGYLQMEGEGVSFSALARRVRTGGAA